MEEIEITLGLSKLMIRSVEKNDKNIAIPPILGTGFSCVFLSSGMSSRPWNIPAFLQSGVSTRDIVREIMKAANIVVIVLLK